MHEYERHVTIGSETATLAVAAVLLATAGLPETPPNERAGLLVIALLLFVFTATWFHLLPHAALGRWRFGVGMSIVELFTAAVLALTGGVDSVYFPYFLLPILATAFVTPRTTMMTAGVALVAFAALTVRDAAAPDRPGTTSVATNFLTIVAVSIVTALIGRAGSRTRLALRELSGRGRELDIVRRVALALGRARDQEELVTTVFAAAREALRAEMVLMLVAVGSGFRGGIAATEHGVETFETDFETNPDLTRSPGRQAARDRRTVVVGDAVAEGTKLSPEIRDRLHLRAGIFVPLVARDQAFGILIFAATVPTQWTAEEIRLAEAIADASAGAVAGYVTVAALRTEAEALAERGRVFEGIDRLGDALAVARSEEEATAAAARGLVDIFRLRGATALLVDPSKAILEPHATAGEVRAHPIVSDPGACPAVRLGRAFRVEGPRSALACPHVPVDGGCFCLPLVAAGEPVGALFLEPLDVMAIDEGAARAAADRVALTVGNARVLETARRQATTDGLTGLYNRRFFEEQMRVTHSLAERHGEGYSVIAIDLDHLKTLNDTMGHEAGDEALRTFTAAMRGTLRGSDIAARFGGDEFVVLASRTAQSDAVLTAERILTDLRSRARTQPHLRISMSAGVASWRPGRSAAEILQAADAMLYRAKSAGRDRVIGEDEPAPA